MSYLIDDLKLTQTIKLATLVKGLRGWNGKVLWSEEHAEWYVKIGGFNFYRRELRQYALSTMQQAYM